MKAGLNIEAFIGLMTQRHQRSIIVSRPREISDSSSISLVCRRIMINVDGFYHKFRATKSETRSATRVLSALHCCAMHHGMALAN